jgi:hypothetical protein
MDKILTLKDKFNKNTFLAIYKTKWHLHSGAYIKPIYTYLFYGSILTAFGIRIAIDGELYNAAIIMGALILMFPIVYLIILLLYKRQYFNHVKEFIIKNENNDIDIIWEFTKEEILYSDHEKSMKYTWPSLKYYSIYKGYIFILAGKNFSASFPFSLDEFDDHPEVIELIKTKLIYLKPPRPIIKFPFERKPLYE